MNKKTWMIAGGAAALLMLCACAAVAAFVFANADSQRKTANFGQDKTVVVKVTDVPATQAPAERPAVKEAPADLAPAMDQDEVDAGKQAADHFLVVLRKHQYDEAVTLTNSNLRGDSTTAGQLRALVEDKGLDPSLWEWLSQGTTDKPSVRLDGAMHFASTKRGTVQVELVQEDGEWKVSGLNLDSSGGSIDPGPLSSWTADREAEEVAFAKSAADVFLMDWRDNDLENAYQMTAQMFRDSLGDQDKFNAFINSVGVTPANWTWDNEYGMIEPDGETHPVIEFTGSVDYQSGKSGKITLQMMWESGFWSVRYMNLE